MPHSSLSEPAQRPARSSSSGGDRPGAGNAADRAVARLVQRVVGNLVHVDVGPDALLVPVRERVQLPDARSAPTTGASACPRGSATGRGGCRRSTRRTARAPRAAARPCGSGSSGPGRAPRGSALLAVLLGDGDASGSDQVEPVALDEPVARLVGLAEEELRVELDHGDVEAELGDHVHEHRRLLLPRARQAELVAELARATQRSERPRRTSSRSRRQEVRAARRQEQHLLQRVAAQAEAQRLERDHLVGRDVAEVDRRAELLDEPGLRRLRRRLEDRRSPTATSCAISSISPVRMLAGRVGRCRRCRPRAPR